MSLGMRMLGAALLGAAVSLASAPCATADQLGERCQLGPAVVVQGHRDQ